MRYPGFFLSVVVAWMCLIPSEGFAQESPKPQTRTIVADLLMIDGDFYIVRGERGEIRIEVTPDTKLTEQFTFGDRIKAVVRPDDSAIMIERAQPGEPVGITTKEGESKPSFPSEPVAKAPIGGPRAEPRPSPGSSPPPSLQAPTRPTTRTVVADLLMIDGDFYVVRGERGEIRIEVTPDTKLSETFRFGDRIKARLLPNDKAISIERASSGDSLGVVMDAPPPSHPQEKAAPSTPQGTPLPEAEGSAMAQAPRMRTIIAEILMIDGDFYVVRGERGEIRIEVTPDTKLSDSFKFGDKIKARVRPNDEAVWIERAGPNEPLGITEEP